jgi:hypothetical protein
MLPGADRFTGMGGKDVEDLPRPPREEIASTVEEVEALLAKVDRVAIVIGGMCFYIPKTHVIKAFNRRAMDGASAVLVRWDDDNSAHILEGREVEARLGQEGRE